MSHLAAYLSCKDAIKTWASAKVPPLRVAEQNVPFTPKEGEIYFRIWGIPSDTRNDDIGLDTETYTGIFQVDVVFPKNKGTGQSGLYIDELTQGVFKRATWLSKGDFKLQLVTPLNPGPTIEEGQNMFTPCSVRYWSRLVNAA